VVRTLGDSWVSAQVCQLLIIEPYRFHAGWAKPLYDLVFVLLEGGIA